MKELDSNIKVIALEPKEAPLLSQGYSGNHLLEGIGDDFIPNIVDRNLIDQIVLIESKDALAMSQKLAHIGLGVGITAGANVLASILTNGEKKNVTVCPDDSKKYLSTQLVTPIRSQLLDEIELLKFEIMENKGKIVAWDLHPHRVQLVEENAKRLGIHMIKTECQDAMIYKEEYKDKFDKILLDVPCLGIGVLKRKPDIKWKRKAEDIKEITQIQQNILETCSKYLKPKGQIVYSTCSIFQEENDKVVEKFLKNNQNFEYTKISPIENENKIQLYQNDETDGFFICKVQKNI